MVAFFLCLTQARQAWIKECMLQPFGPSCKEQKWKYMREIRWYVSSDVLTSNFSRDCIGFSVSRIRESTNNINILSLITPWWMGNCFKTVIKRHLSRVNFIHTLVTLLWLHDRWPSLFIYVYVYLWTHLGPGERTVVHVWDTISLKLRCITV